MQTQFQFISPLADEQWDKRNRGWIHQDPEPREIRLRGRYLHAMVFWLSRVYPFQGINDLFVLSGAESCGHQGLRFTASK